LIGQTWLKSSAFAWRNVKVLAITFCDYQAFSELRWMIAAVTRIWEA